MTTRYNPFAEVERFFEQMSRQFEEVSGSFEGGEGVNRWTAAFESMAVDVVDHDGEFVVTADLPGFEHDDIDLRVTDSRLHIEAQHEEELEEDTEEETGRHIRRERRHRSLSRAIDLPEEVNVEGVEASMKNGVLHVTLPKQMVETAHHIQIESR